ncbi:MAG: PIN domain-containing protein [Caldilineaceae bacterium]|nr:PIN domain-containing protein [Caldilineaceae bacterium]
MHFVDTNILIYAATPAPDEVDKQRTAQHLLDSDDLAFSVQVLQEFYYQATRLNRPEAITHDQALRFIESISRFPVQDVTLEVFHTAAAISQRFGLSYWDGAILAAARTLGCDAVYSEDLSAEQDYDGLQVINPFADVTRS